MPPDPSSPVDPPGPAAPPPAEPGTVPVVRAPASVPMSPGGPPTYRLRDLDRRGRALALLAALLLVVPIGASLLRAVDQGWVPSNDEAQIVLRARDVLSADPPLVGQPSTAGAYAEDHPARHPGPIEFYLLAVPVRALGTVWGTLLTVAAITAASVWLTAWSAFRRAGPAVGLGAVVLVAAVTWSTGTAVLTDPISSNVGGYPLLAGTALAWALWGDDRRLWPLAVGVWSFTAQQHLAVLGPAGVVVAWGTLAAVVTTARARQVRESLRWAVASVVVGVVCWLPPLVDQVVGDGNLAYILGFSREGERGSLGLVAGVRATARALGFPPLFLRRDFDGGDLVAPLSSAAVVGAVVGLAAAVVVAVTAAARVRRGPPAPDARARLALVGTGLVLAAAGVVTTANVPDSAEQLRINFYRWTWPVAVAVWGAVAWAVAEVVAARVPARPRWVPRVVPLVVLALVAVVVGGAATGDGVSDRRRDDLAFRFEAEAADAVLAAIDRDRSVHVATRGQAAFLAVSPALVLALEDAGVDVRLETSEADLVDEAQRAGYGPHRLELDDDPGARVYVVTGRWPLLEVPGEVVAEVDLGARVDELIAEVLADVDGPFVPGPDAAEVRESFGPDLQEYLDFVLPLFETDPALALRGTLGVDVVRAGYFASPSLDDDLLLELRRAEERGIDIWGDEVLRIVVDRLD